MTIAKPGNPQGDPPLAAMDARTARLKAELARLLPIWEALLTASGGNIARAGRAAQGGADRSTLGFPVKEEPEACRDRAQRLTRRLGLVEYAETLRLASGARTGRPRKVSA